VAGSETLAVPVVDGNTLLVVAHGYASEDQGPFELTAAFEAARCGNHALDPGEACDDGARVGGDGCSAACELEACTSPTVITTTVSGDITNATSVLGTSCANALSGPEHVYSFTAPAVGSYVATLTPSADADVVLATRTTCAEATSEICVDEEFFGGVESLTLALNEGETAFLIVEGWGVPDRGSYELEIGRK
jgi:cysteine-rich repeat protein